MSAGAGRIAAIDIGGTKLKACLFTDGTPSQRVEADTCAARGAAAVLAGAAELLAQWEPFDALGVSTAGQVDPDTGCIRYANENLPGYTGTDVRSYFMKIFGCPVAVVNDVYAAALGEGLAGAVVGEKNYLCITYGTGIGGGVVIDGALYYGMGPSAGVMLGGIITHPEAVAAGDAFSGTYERYASVTALVKKSCELDPSLTDGRKIFEKISEPGVKAVIDDWLDEIAVGLCTLIHAFNVPCIVIGGGIMVEPYAIAGIKQRVEESVIPGFHGVRLVGAALGNMAGLYGAEHLARQLLQA